MTACIHLIPRHKITKNVPSNCPTTRLFVVSRRLILTTASISQAFQPVISTVTLSNHTARISYRHSSHLCCLCLSEVQRYLMVGSVIGIVCTSIFKRLLVPLLRYKALLLYGSNDGTRLSETIFFFFWTMSIFLTVNRLRRLGNWLCFHVRMKWEETLNLVGPLRTTNSLYKLRQWTKSRKRRLFHQVLHVHNSAACHEEEWYNADMLPCRQ